MNISDLFAEKSLVKVCAPMVRYSKLEFRSLVRKYDCDLCFTPMIMADSFVKSEKARRNEFTTNEGDSPLIVQFAANNISEFSEAAQLVSPYSSGVDLNCGCPQRWAMKIGIGAFLLSDPEIIKNIVSTTRNQISKDYSVSVKLRLLSNVKSTVDLCRKLEKAGASFLTIHARTKEQKTQPINVEALRDIAQSVQIPVIANGDVKTLDDAKLLQEATFCKGIMSARGILQNPAMFKGYPETPIECIRDWVQIALDSNLHFITFHHHLVFMLEKILQKRHRRKFNNMTNYYDVLCFLNQFFGFDFDYSPSNIKSDYDIIWDDVKNPGKYFSEKTNCEIDDDMEFFLYDSFGLYQ